jgi:hypothetical protein
MRFILSRWRLRIEGVKERGREGGRVGKEIHFLIQAHTFKRIAHSIVI